MCNYSVAKLELLVLKWVVTEKFHNYLLGSHTKVYMDNNPYKIANLVYHKSNGLVSWHCSILPSNTKQALPTRLQMH